MAGYEAAKLDITRSANDASRLQSLSNTLATFAGIVGVPLVAKLRGPGLVDGWAPVFASLGVCFFLAAAVFHVRGRWAQPYP